jgi:hypothetical protein
MQRQFIFFLFSASSLMSCGKTNWLSEEDYKWMPYIGNETLVFKSNKNEADTIFFLRKDTLWGYPDPVLSTGKYEEAAIFSKHADSYTSKENYRYLENYFLKIKKTNSRRAEIVIDLSAMDAKFYRLSPIKIDSLNKEKPSTLQTQYGHYDDVYVINAEDYLGTFHQRSNFITKLYWSKSQGLIRYDKMGDVYWELKKKY